MLWYNPGTGQLTGFGNVLSENVGGPAAGTADQISVAVDGRVWALSNNTVEYFDPGTQSLQVFSGAPSLTQVSAGEGANVRGG